jgi:hypothetical protein
VVHECRPLVTGGVKHVKFWVMEGGYLVGKNGVYGRMGSISTVLSISFHSDGSTLTGTQGGVAGWCPSLSPVNPSLSPL